MEAGAADGSRRRGEGAPQQDPGGCRSGQPGASRSLNNTNLVFGGKRSDAGLQRALVRRERLHEIGIALSSESSTERLLEIILLGAKELTGADAGTLYRLGEDARLHFSPVRNDSLGIALGGTTGEPVTFDPLPLHDEAGEPIRSSVAVCAALEGVTFNIPDAYSAPDFDFSGTRAVDRRTGYVSRSFLDARTVEPLTNRNHYRLTPRLIGLTFLPRTGGTY